MSLDCPTTTTPPPRFALVPTGSQKMQLALYLTVMSGSPLEVPFSSDPSPGFLVLVRKTLFRLLTSLASGAQGLKEPDLRIGSRLFCAATFPSAWCTVGIL